MKKLRQKWLRALPAVAFFCAAVTLAMAVYTFHWEPERYRASCTVYALPAGASSDADAAELARMLCRDCDLLINTPEFQQKALQNARSDGKTRLYVRQADGGHMLRVEAVGENAGVAAGLSNAAADVLLEELSGRMGAGEVHLVSRAETPEEPFAPNRPVKIAAAFLLSFALFSLIALLIPAPKERARWNPRELPDEGVPCPCLTGVAEYDGCLRRMSRERRRGGQSTLADSVDELTRENVRELVLQLRSRQPKPGCSVVMAGLEDEDSATLSLLTASELAAQGFEVLLMEMDSYAPSLRKWLGVQGTMDVVDCLQREDALRTALLSTPIPRLLFMDVCHEPGFLSRIAARPGFAAFLTDAAQSFDYVILNAPPCQSVSDAALLGALADRTVVVAQDGRYTPRELEGMLRAFAGRVRCLEGVVFCRVPLKSFSRTERRALRS